MHKAQILSDWCKIDLDYFDRLQFFESRKFFFVCIALNLAFACIGRVRLCSICSMLEIMI